MKSPQLRHPIQNAILVLLTLLLASTNGVGHVSFAQAMARSDDGNDKAAVTLNGQSGATIENSRIRARLSLHDNHISMLSVQGKSAHTASISIENPFSMELTDLGVLRASDFSIPDPPTVEQLTANPAAARLSEHFAGVALHYKLVPAQGTFSVVWTIVLREGSSYIRQLLSIQAEDQPLPLTDLKMIDVHAPDGLVQGTVKGSPITSGNFYFGFESPLSESSFVAGRAVSELHFGVPIAAGLSAQYSSVVGIAEDNQMRRSFQAYLERERAHPYRTFLHYNSWFDIGFFTPYTQQDALNRIHAYGEELVRKRGVVLDSFLFDDGWDDHDDLWKIRSDFKDGFEPLKQAAAKYGTAPGVWLSPWGGYGSPKQERLAAAKRDGFEIVDDGLALSGPKYYARFYRAVMEMVTKFSVNQFKLDGTGNADQVVKGSKFNSDFDAAIHLIEDVRQVKPDIFINLTTGTYPSPFWLFYADSIWRGGDDTEFAGVGTYRERWITYRDADTYEGIVKAGRLFPLNSLMLHGIVYAQKAPNLSTDPGDDFRNEVRSYFGSGTQLQELYMTPSLLTSKNWDDLAEAAKWSRRNASILADTHWIGGDPRWLEVYGWAAWSPKKSIVTLRNPSAAAQTYNLDLAETLQLPPGAAKRYSARSPWHDEVDRPALNLQAGKPEPIHLAPFEVLTLEITPE